MNVLKTCERYFTPIGRIILGAFFVLGGIDKMMDMAGTAAYIESAGLPAGSILVLGAILIEVGVGGALLIGYRSRYAALTLAAFVLFVSFVFHGPTLWAENPIQNVLFMKNIAILGGLLFMAAHIGAPCCTAPQQSTAQPTPTL